MQFFTVNAAQPKTYSFLFACILLFVTLSFTMGESCAVPVKGNGGWVKLGSRKVTYRVDNDVINVNVPQRGFHMLKVVVKDGNLNMRKMVVVYGNGTRQDIPMKFKFTRNSSSRIIDLRGGSRIIKRINFWYDTANYSNRKATVHVYAKK